MSVPDLAVPVRDALVGSAAVTAGMAAYKGGYPVFTRVPTPDDAPYPMVVVMPQVQVGEEDGVDDQRPVIQSDIIAYGRNDSAAHYNAAETAAFAVHALFHRQRGAVTVSGWSVTEITAAGPAPAPTPDDQVIGRRVSVQVRLARRN